MNVRSVKRAGSRGSHVGAKTRGPGRSVVAGAKQHGDKQHGDKQHSDKQHDNKQHGDKQHSAKQHDEKQHDEKQHDEKQHGARRQVIDQAKPTRRRGRPLTDDKRRRILDAALVLFAKRGYHGTAVPDVADATGVGTGTLYRYFEDKQHLVNEVYRDAKQRLKAALLDGLVAPSSTDDTERWFHELWDRLATFARREPDAFRFLEMQDHVEYLDAKSRALEITVLAPLWLTGKRLFAGGPPVDVAIALLWGAFVGVVKAQRLGYLALDDKKLRQAGAAAWRLIAPQRR